MPKVILLIVITLFIDPVPLGTFYPYPHSDITVLRAPDLQMTVVPQLRKIDLVTYGSRMQQRIQMLAPSK